MAITNPIHPLSKEVAEQLREQMRRMLVRLDELRALAPSPSSWMPPVDICEMEESIKVRVELPGVSTEHIRLTLLDNQLKFEGRKERASPTGHLTGENERPIRFLCLERSYGGFSFTITLRWPVDVTNIRASLSDGVLQIDLPKTTNCGREIRIPIME